MSPSPAERFSALLARSGERGWSPDDDLGDEDDHRDDHRPTGRRHAHHRCTDDDLEDDEAEDDGDERVSTGVRPGLSRTLLLGLLGVVLTAVLVLVLAPSLLRGEDPLPDGEDDGWEAAQAEAAADPGDTASSHGPDGDDGETGTVFVHVVGAVGAPGVVDLPASSRVSDAVEAAGGAQADADIDALNLARVLVDGEQIRVPRIGEEPGPATGAGGGTAGGADTGGPAAGGGSGGAADPHAAGGGLIDLNAADAAQLETLPGIGPVTAQSIIDHREAIGRFGSVDELLDVTGIGDATLARIRESVTVG